jgi:hypothetical protein
MTNLEWCYETQRYARDGYFAGLPGQPILGMSDALAEEVMIRLEVGE